MNLYLILTVRWYLSRSWWLWASTTTSSTITWIKTSSTSIPLALSCYLLLVVSCTTTSLILLVLASSTLCNQVLRSPNTFVNFFKFRPTAASSSMVFAILQPVLVLHLEPAHSKPPFSRQQAYAGNQSLSLIVLVVVLVVLVVVAIISQNLNGTYTYTTSN